MSTTATDLVPIRSGDDVVRVRQEVRAIAGRAGLSLVDQTKIVTAASELARNTLDYGGGGTARITLLHEGGRRGVRVVFEDQGPGIFDIEQALRDGFTTGKGLGGARRLCNEFLLETEVGTETRVTIARWR